MRRPQSDAEKQIARNALAKAKDLIAAGTNNQDAATFACLDCSEWRCWTLAILEGRESVWRIISTPQEAAETTKKTYGSRAKDQCLRRAERAENAADAAFWREVADLL